MCNNFSWKILICSFLVLHMADCTNQDCSSRVYSGEYLGLVVSSDTAEIFAPNFINNGLSTRDVAMTPDKKEIYFTQLTGGNKYFTIVVTKEINGVWTDPVIADFARDLTYNYIEPAISPDGSKFYFVSNLSDSGKPKSDMDIFFMERIGEGWGKPTNIGAPISSELGEFFPSLTIDGTLYFSRDLPNRTSKVFRSRLVNGKYETPIQLGPEVNAGISTFNAFISPDESYIITPTFGMEDSYGATDYYITFRNNDDTWNGPYNMGAIINSESRQEWSAYVSPDNKYIFFMSDRSVKLNDNRLKNITRGDLISIHNSPGNGLPTIFWTGADIIDELRKETEQN
jgi:hypothetical protein